MCLHLENNNFKEDRKINNQIIIGVFTLKLLYNRNTYLYLFYVDTHSMLTVSPTILTFLVASCKGNNDFIACNVHICINYKRFTTCVDVFPLTKYFRTICFQQLQSSSQKVNNNSWKINRKKGRLYTLKGSAWSRM